MADETGTGGAASPATPTRPRSAAADFLERVGKLRDGLLVAGGLLYVLGYAVWSVNAWRSGLGVLPALEFQYLVAGFVPAASLVILFLLAKAIIKLFQKVEPPAGAAARLDARAEVQSPPEAEVQSPPEEAADQSRRGTKEEEDEGLAKEKATKLVITWLVVLGIAVVALYIVLYKSGRLPESAKDPERWGSTAFTITAFVLVVVFNVAPDLLAPYLKRGGPKLGSKLRGHLAGVLDRWPGLRTPVILFSLAVCLAGGGFLIFKWLSWYPELPQALGGFQPRCARLDVARKDISADTLAAVAPGAATRSAASFVPAGGVAPAATPAPAEDGQIVRSEQIHVLFSGSDYMLIRSAGGAGKVYEIKKDVVRAVAPCGESSSGE